MNKSLKSILVIISYFVFYVVMYLPFAIFDINLSSIPDYILSIYQMGMETILIVVLILIYLKDFRRFIKDFKENAKQHLKTGIDYWFIGIVIMIISNIIIGTFSPISLPENEQAVREALKLNPIFIFLSIVLLAPILEEILFRHTLFEIIKNKPLYVIISGLLFGSFHILGIASSIFSWLYVIPYAALGIAFAYAYVKTNNLLVPITMHAFHNFITVIQLLILM